MEMLWIVLGFSFAAYAIVANDSIQTLGTFLSSNQKRPWWLLWIWISGIFVVTLSYGWLSSAAATFAVNGVPASLGQVLSGAVEGVGLGDLLRVQADPAYGRLEKWPEPDHFSWVFILPPLALIFLTRWSMPVSTTFLILTLFEPTNLGGMVYKSLFGYGLAFATGLLLCISVVWLVERRVSDVANPRAPSPLWVPFQWLATAFIWSMWLIQDLANVFIYTPRRIDFSILALAIGGMVVLQGYLIYKKGGGIQRVVLSKTNATDIRSASIIDLLYGVVLLTFKEDMFGLFPAKMPMSTTWVFLGLLAGREVGLALRLRHRTQKKVGKVVFGDLGRATVGLIVSTVIALLAPLLDPQLRASRGTTAVVESAPASVTPPPAP